MCPTLVKLPSPKTRVYVRHNLTSNRFHYSEILHLKPLKVTRSDTTKMPRPYIRHWRFLTPQRNLTPPDTSYGCYKSFVLEYSPMHADILPTGLDYSMSMEHCWGSQAYPTQQAHTVFKFRFSSTFFTCIIYVGWSEEFFLIGQNWGRIFQNHGF